MNFSFNLIDTLHFNLLEGAVEAEKASVDDGRRLHPGRGRGERAHRGGQLPRERATEHRGAEGVRRVVPAQERERDSQTEAATPSSKRKVREDWNELSDFSQRKLFHFQATTLRSQSISLSTSLVYRSKRKEGYFASSQVW